MWWNRPDGVLVGDVPDYRRIMPYLMRGRNESAFYMGMTLDVTGTQHAIHDFNLVHPGTPITLFHVVLHALATTLHERPAINRFVAGGRLYQRRGVYLSWAAKQRFTDGAPLTIVKRRFPAAEPFASMVADVERSNGEARHPERGPTDRELAAVLALPGTARRGVLALERAADRFGLLPRSYIDNDPLFASAFLANLGSLGLDAGFHHMYEYGSIGLFCVIGRITETPVAGPAGGHLARREAEIRFTYDERLEDGAYAGRALERFRELVETPVISASSAMPVSMPSRRTSMSAAVS